MPPGLSPSKTAAILLTDGRFYAIYRVYMPGEAVLNGTWKKPQMQPVPIK